jgi:hypothetical protein
MAVLATDDFNRANNTDLGANWNVQTGETRLDLNSNAVRESSQNSDCAENNSAVTWPDDQYSQVKVTLSGSPWSDHSGGGPGVRMSSSAQTYYRAVCNINSSNTIGIGKKVAGSFTQLGTRSTTYAAATVVYLEVQGSTLLVKYGGTTLGAGISDSSITTGRAGLTFSSEQAGRGATLDDWEGGDFSGGGGVTVKALAALGVG